MKKYFRKLNDGFSLVEAVVSILLVSIIMTAVLSTVLYTNSVTKKAEKKMYAINEIDNIIHCFEANDFSYYGLNEIDDSEENVVIEIKYNNEFQRFDSSDYYYKLVLNINTLNHSVYIRAYDSIDETIYQMKSPYVLGGSG